MKYERSGRTNINKHYRDFTANTLEEAFVAVKAQYGVESLEALSYDVIQNEKTGVFGIIKPQKAVVRIYESKRRKEKQHTVMQSEQQAQNIPLRDAMEYTLATSTIQKEDVETKKKTKKQKKGSVIAHNDGELVVHPADETQNSITVTEVIQSSSTAVMQKEKKEVLQKQNRRKRSQQNKKAVKDIVEKAQGSVYTSTSIEGRSLLHTSTRKKKNVLMHLRGKTPGNATLITLVSETLLRIIKAFGIETPYNITLEDQNRLHIAIRKSKKTACLLGEDNEVLRAIQYILYKILMQQSENEVLLTITLGEHRVSEETIFEANIRKLCKKVLSTRQSVQTYQLTQEQYTKACGWLAEEKDIAYVVIQEDDKYTLVLSYKE